MEVATTTVVTTTRVVVLTAVTISLFTRVTIVDYIMDYNVMIFVCTVVQL